MDVLKTFKLFLEKNNVLESFTNNVLNSCGYETVNVFSEDFLFYAFCWGLSPEGHKFWETLNITWKTISHSLPRKTYKMKDIILYLSINIPNEEELWTM